MPTSVGGQVSGTTKHFVTLVAAIFDSDDARAHVEGQSERVCIPLLAKLTDEFSKRNAGVGALLHLIICLLRNAQPEDGRCGYLMAEAGLLLLVWGA